MWIQIVLCPIPNSSLGLEKKKVINFEKMGKMAKSDPTKKKDTALGMHVLSMHKMVY